MTPATLAEHLTEIQFTAQLPAAVRQALSEIAGNRTFATGEFLCRENDRIAELFLIISGRVGLDMFVPGRGQVRVQTLGPGEIVAWSAIVSDQVATATGTAVEDTHVIVFPADSMLALFQTNHDVGYLIMKQLSKTISRRLVTTRLQLLDLFAGESRN